MNVTLLLGRANTGKSAAIFDRLATCQRAGERAVLIVPEQYTFEAERALSERLGGLMGVEVTSFDRLNERVLTLAGLVRPFLNDQGYRMVIRRSALMHRERLSVFSAVADRPGFPAEMQSIFSDLKRAGLSAGALSDVCEKLDPASALYGKLSDIALLYGDVEAYLESRYMTLEDAAEAACDLLPASFLSGLPVFIDGVDRPSAQLFRWLDALMRTAGSLTLSLRVDPAFPADAELFLPDIEVVSRIRDMADRLDIPVKTEHFTARSKPCAPALAHLERNLFASPAPPFEENADSVMVFGASDRLAETEALADAILSCARRGVRYRETAVIVSDADAYMPLIERVFRRRGIPVFLDRKRPVTEHAAVDAVLAALSAVCEGFPPAELLRLAKSGYAGVSREDAEEFELYLLRTGLRGSAFTKPFTRGDVPEGAQRARSVLIKPLLALRDALHARTAGEKARALYAYLVEIELQKRLTERADALLGEGRITLMEEHAQVWNALVALLDQMAAILSDVPLSRELFTQLMREGLSGMALGVIPSTSDQVLIGDVARTKSRAVRSLFLLGVNDGLLPAARGDDGLIDDRELLLLTRAGLPAWPDTKRRAAADRLDLYSALSKARDTLFVGYSFTDGSGHELAPSTLIADILRLLPRCALETDIVSSDALPAGPSEGLMQLSRDLSVLATDRVLTPRLPTLLNYYQNDPRYAARVRRMLASSRVRFSCAPFGRASAAALFGDDIRMSASRLEQFAACPFKHFMRYGLAAQDRREYTERAADTGSFYHAALDAFVREAISRALDWRSITDADCDALIDDVLPGVIAEHNGGIFLHNERLRATLFLLVASVKQSARAVLAHIRAGAFQPASAEVRFGDDAAFPPILLRLSDGTTARLSGVIDRVDRASVAGKDALRVVDYKLGGREFDFTGVLLGLTLQLPLYLLAATQKGARAAGMYYMPLTVPASADTADLEAAARDAFRLNGLTLSDPAVVRASDIAAAEGAPAVLKGVKRAGEDAFAGSVVTSSELDTLLAAAKRRSEQLFSRMLDGVIDADPYEGACTYCDYRSACRFDPMVRGCRARKVKKLGADEFFAQIGGDAHGMD